MERHLRRLGQLTHGVTRLTMFAPASVNDVRRLPWRLGGEAELIGLKG